MFGIDIAAFFAKPIVKYGGPVLVVAGIIAGFFIWLHFHDVGVRKAERERIEQETHEISQERANEADGAQEKRDETFNSSQAELRNAADTDDYFKRLRDDQCRQRPSRC